MSRLINFLSESIAKTGHFQWGVKLPLRRFAEPLRGATPPPSNSSAVARSRESRYLSKKFTRRATNFIPALPSPYFENTSLPKYSGE